MDDAVNIGLHYILLYLDSPEIYSRILFVDFRSAQNTVIPSSSQYPHPLYWMASFLTDRMQQVKVGSIISSTQTNTIINGPQRRVLSPLIFSFYTNYCTSGDPSVEVLNYADELTVMGLIQDIDKSAQRRDVEQLVH